MKTRIPLPFGHKKNKFLLPVETVTTSDFGYISPICLLEMVPGDDFTARAQSFCRLAPLPVPTFSDVTLETCAFYVPLRQLWRDGREFFLNQKYFNSDTGLMKDAKVPCICNSMLVATFLNSQLSTSVSPGSGVQYDFMVNLDGQQNEEYRNFTPRGRRLYSFLINLGYQITFDLTDNTRMSLLPYLAICHISHEYYYPQLAYPNPEISILLSHDSYYYDIACTTWEMSEQSQKVWDAASNLGKTLFLDMDIVYMSYLKNDYFTSAWKSPTGNSSEYNGTSLESRVEIRVPDSATNVKVVSSSDSSLRPQLSSSSGLSNVGLNLLKAVTNYVTRNSVAGNKMVDRFFARFGIKLDDLSLQRPVYLGKSTQQVSISDVTSTASVPNGSAVGDYAGKGTSYGNGEFKYSADEYGYFIVLQTIVPHTGVVSGRKRHVLHLSFDEFYMPEFDCIGVQAIRKDEVYSRFTDSDKYASAKATGYSPNGVFGYAPRYAEYKFGHKTLSGDFATGSHYKNMSSYHLYRDISPLNLKLDRGFLSASADVKDNNFSRIFSYTGNDFDHFFLVHQVDVTAYRNMHQIGDTLDLEDVHGGEGRSVEVTYGGNHQ